MREPTAEQLADHLNMNPEKVTHALQQTKWTTSIDTVYGEEEYCWLDMISCNDYLPDETLMAESHTMELECMLAKLTERERLVIELTYGLTGQTEMSPAYRTGARPQYGTAKQRKQTAFNLCQHF